MVIHHLFLLSFNTQGINFKQESYMVTTTKYLAGGVHLQGRNNISKPTVL